MTTDSSPDRRFGHRSGTIAVLTFSALVVVGSVSPWMTTPQIDFVGVQLIVGVLTGLLALSTGGFAIRTLHRRGTPFGGHRFVNVILGAILVFVSIGFLIAADRNGTAINYGVPVDPGIGWGLIVTALSSAGVLVSATIVLGQSTKS